VAFTPNVPGEDADGELPDEVHAVSASVAVTAAAPIGR